MDEFDGCVFYDTYERQYHGTGNPVRVNDASDPECRCCVVVNQSVLSWEVDRVHGEPVWPAANLLCCFLTSDRGVRACAGRRVLEVGAGVGLTGLVAAHFASYVCMTDGDEEHLPLLRRNARENGPKCVKRKSGVCRGECGTCCRCYEHICRPTEVSVDDVSASGTIAVQHLWWGYGPAEEAAARANGALEKNSFDLVIGSDIVYLREGVNALVETINYFLRTDTPDAGAYIMNVAHHMTNLDMLREACVRCSLSLSLVPLDSFVPIGQQKEFPNAYMAHITRKCK